LVLKPSNSLTRKKLGQVIPKLVVSLFSWFHHGRSEFVGSPINTLVGNSLVYATYSVDGRIREDEMEFLVAASRNGWNIIVINNGMEIITLDGVDALIINRENRGRDLGAFSHAVRTISFKEGELIFANSSINWSDEAFDVIYRDIVLHEEKVIFLAESNQPFIHGQSFFVWFSKRALERNAHIIAFSGVRLWRSKRLLVWNEELPIMRRMISHNINVGFLFSYDALLAEFRQTFESNFNYSPVDKGNIESLISRNILLNPSIHFAPYIYHKYGIFKMSLLTNPAQMETPTYFLQGTRS
jgi:hypothetical protein